MSENQKRLIILGGPTAVGKTALSLELATRINGEIVSADSMQVYRHMDIGTAKIRPQDMRGIRHHLIDVLEPTDDFDVAQFQQMALAAMEDIYGRGHVPVLTGGTGFYIHAVLYRTDFTETNADRTFRLSLEKRVEEEGEAGVFALWERLKEVDAESADNLDPHNVKRVIRALEFYEQTGTPISAHNRRERQKPSPYDFRFFVLTDRREKLYEQIDKRVDDMLKAGLVEEVKKLKDMGVTAKMTSMQGLGYREILAFLDGQYDLERATALIKQNTRHFAKRQLTWFRKEKDVIWLNKSDFDGDENRMLEKMLCDL